MILKWYKRYIKYIVPHNFGKEDIIMKTLEKLTEENVFKYFSEISKIPRGSGN